MSVLFLFTNMETILSILIADLAGYTALTDIHGGSVAADVVSKFTEITKNSLAHSCELIETVGDEMMIISKNSDKLLETTFHMRESLLSEINFLGFHAGLHRGSCVSINEKLFGTTINLTSRLANYASRNQVLCTHSFREDLTDLKTYHFTNLGELKFKNLATPWEVFEIDAHTPKIREHTIDPVCKMHFYIDENSLRSSFEDQEYYFCSQACLDRFKEEPSNFI